MPTLTGTISPTDFLLPGGVVHNSSDLVNLRFSISGSGGAPSAGVTWTFESTHDAPWWAQGEGGYSATPPGPTTNYYATHSRVGQISGVHTMNVTGPGSVFVADFPLGETITVTVEAATAAELEGLFLHGAAEFATLTGPWTFTASSVSNKSMGLTAGVMRVGGQRNLPAPPMLNTGAGYSVANGTVNAAAARRSGLVPVPAALIGRAVRAMVVEMKLGGYLGFAQFQTNQRSIMCRLVTSINGKQGAVPRQSITPPSTLVGAAEGEPIFYGATAAALGPEGEPYSYHYDFTNNYGAPGTTQQWRAEPTIPMRAALGTGFHWLLTPTTVPPWFDNEARWGSVLHTQVAVESAPATWTTVTFDVPLAPEVVEGWWVDTVVLPSA